MYGSCPKYVTSLYARPTFPRFTAQGHNPAGKPILSEGLTPEGTRGSKILALSASVEFFFFFFFLKKVLLEVGQADVQSGTTERPKYLASSFSEGL